MKKTLAVLALVLVGVLTLTPDANAFLRRNRQAAVRVQTNNASLSVKVRDNDRGLFRGRRQNQVNVVVADNHAYIQEQRQIRAQINVHGRNNLRLNQLNTYDYTNGVQAANVRFVQGNVYYRQQAPVVAIQRQRVLEVETQDYCPQPAAFSSRQTYFVEQRRQLITNCR
jgi:hypothetical protein